MDLLVERPGEGSIGRGVVRHRTFAALLRTTGLLITFGRCGVLLLGLLAVVFGGFALHLLGLLS